MSIHDLMLQLLLPLRFAWLLIVVSLWQDGTSHRPSDQDHVQQASSRAGLEQHALKLDDKHAHKQFDEQGVVTNHNKTTQGSIDSIGSQKWKPPPTWQDHPIAGSQHWKKNSWRSRDDRASICFENHAYPCGKGKRQCCCRIGCKYTGLNKLEKGTVDTCDCSGGGPMNPQVQTYTIPRSINKDSHWHFCKKGDGLKKHAHECGGDDNPGCCCNGGYDYSLDLHKCVPSEDPHFKRQHGEEAESDEAEAAQAAQEEADEEQKMLQGMRSTASWLRASFVYFAPASTVLVLF